MLKLRLELTNKDGEDSTIVEITDASINHYSTWSKIFWVFINALNGAGYTVKKDIDFIAEHLEENDY
jgi:hypothetical protein